MHKVNIIFAEFYSKNKINFGNFRDYFPDADFTIFDEMNSNFVYERNHPRFGNRMNDYYKIKGMLESKSDIAIAFDADMQIVSDDVKTIIPLTQKFGLCLPSNPRYMVRVDTIVGADSDQVLDETNGTAYALNAAIMAFDTKNKGARMVLEEAERIMRETPVRLPLALWRAIYEIGFSPCLLPPQWCLCEGHEGIGNEIVLHVGHKGVRDFYAVNC